MQCPLFNAVRKLLLSASEIQIRKPKIQCWRRPWNIFAQGDQNQTKSDNLINGLIISLWLISAWFLRIASSFLQHSSSCIAIILQPSSVVSSMKSISGTFAYWPGMGKEVEEVVQRYSKSQQVPKPPQTRNQFPGLKLHLHGPAYTWILLDLSMTPHILSW